MWKIRSIYSHDPVLAFILNVENKVNIYIQDPVLAFTLNLKKGQYTRSSIGFYFKFKK